MEDLSTSGAFRALPSQESNLTITQVLPGGNLFLKAQYLQPLDNGGSATFQRLPEIGHHISLPTVLGSPVSIGMDSNFVHFYREEGFTVSRLDLMPGMEVEGLHLGHILGLRPQVKLREVIYSRGQGVTETTGRDRGTVWLGVEANSSLSRRFALGENRLLRHTIKPSVMYEYVPPTKQSDLVQIDAVDNFTEEKPIDLFHLVSSSGEKSGRAIDHMVRPPLRPKLPCWTSSRSGQYFFRYLRPG